MMPKLPIFTSDAKAAEWFATHDTAPYMDELVRVTEEIRVRRTRSDKKSAKVWLRADYAKAIRVVAERKGMTYQTLVQTWLAEKLRQEAPDLMIEGQAA
jgi:folate-dependent phosphoribosylglycinamide formyltransferase PurN